MPFTQQFPRNRDVYALSKGDSYAVNISSAMKSGGWQGGQGVKWTDSTKDEFLVTYSDGLYGGLLLWGSNEDSDVLTSMTGNEPLYGFAVLCAGGWVIATRTFEKYTYQSRQAGPLVLNNYTVGERLVLSLRGWVTRQDEWAITSDPRGSNGYFMANVVQAPSVDNNFFLTVQTSI